LLMSPPVFSGGLLWDTGIGFGYACVILAVCLYVFPVRGDGLPHRRLLGLTQHRRAGWVILGTASLHAGILLGSQSSVGLYLLPSAPLFMWCGLAALVLAAVLVQTGLAVRSVMRRSAIPGRSERFASLHLILAALMMAIVCAHIAGSAQVLSGAIKTATVLSLLVLPLLWFAFRARPRRATRDLARRASQAAAAALIPLMPAPTASRLLLEPAAQPARIHVNFPHESHISVNCASCHHNFVDHTGSLACIECHRGDSPSLPRSSEATFHVFCRSCHTRLALDGLRHGPTRACSGCHRVTPSGRF